MDQSAFHYFHANEQDSVQTKSSTRGMSAKKDLLLSQKITLLLIAPWSKLKSLPDKDKQKGARAFGLQFFK